MPDPDVERALARYRTLAFAFDARFRLPGTPLRFGWDALLGLIPGVGDIAGGVLGAFGVWTGWRAGAPAALLLRMLLNVVIDVVVGTVPVAGDLFDVGWRSNSRNVTLLERWSERPRAVRKESAALMAGLGALLLAVLGAAAWISIQVLRLVLGAVG